MITGRGWRRWMLAGLALATLCTACDSAPGPDPEPDVPRYPASIDPCRLPDWKTMTWLVHDSAEVAPDTVPPLDHPNLPPGMAADPKDYKSCDKTYFYGHRDTPGLQGVRYVSVVVASFHGTPHDAIARAREVMADTDGTHGHAFNWDEPPPRVADVGNEAVATDTWAAARCGNVVVFVSFVDTGRAVGMFGEPTQDNLAGVITDMVKNLKILYAEPPSS